jgi:2-polyprenyl-3-methyl-5-hydroxy-6-metoxy-1,4-benzoquinol methylase
MEYSANDKVWIRCLLCGSGSDATFMFVKGYRIARCVNCNFIFVNPRPTQQSLLGLYSNQQTNPFHKERYEAFEYELPVLTKIIRKIQQYIPTGELLEVGCGRGDFLRVARLNGFSVSGCDVFGGRTPVSDGITFYDSTLKDVKLPENSFDVVVIRNILEHLFNPNVEILEVKRILRPKGYLYIKVPNAEFEHGLRCRLVFGRKHVMEPPYHLNYFSPNTLHTFLINAQFEFLSWHLEQPTLHPKWTKNLLWQTGYGLIKMSSFLSAGKIFPKPLLSCLAVNTGAARNAVS